MLEVKGFKMPLKFFEILIEACSVEKLQSPSALSGTVSCNSGRASDADSNRAVRTARETSKTKTLRNKAPFIFPTSPCW